MKLGEVPPQLIQVHENLKIDSYMASARPQSLIRFSLLSIVPICGDDHIESMYSHAYSCSGLAYFRESGHQSGFSWACICAAYENGYRKQYINISCAVV